MTPNDSSATNLISSPPLQFQLPNVELEQFYSRLLPETEPSTEPEQSRKPTVLSVMSATFAYKSTRMRFDEDEDDDQDYVLKSVSCDIKKVRFPVFASLKTGNINNLSRNRETLCASKDRWVVEKVHF